MKKTLLIMLLAIVATMTATAQSLTAKDWGAETEGYKGASVSIVTSFETDGTCTMLMFLDQTIERGEVMMAMVAPGTYTFDGHNLRLKIDTKKADFYDDIDMKASNKNLSNKMNHVMKQEIEKAVPGLKQRFLGIVDDYSNLTVTKLTRDKMVTTIGTFAGYDKGTLRSLLTD